MVTFVAAREAGNVLADRIVERELAFLLQQQNGGGGELLGDRADGVAHLRRGPTGAFVVIVAGIVARFGMSGLAMVTVMAGILLLGWASPAGRNGSLHSAHGGDRIHQRHCHPDCIHADQGLFRAEDGRRSQRISAPHHAAGGAFQRPESGGAWPGIRHAGDSVALPRILRSAFRRRLWRCWFARGQRRVSSAGGDHREQVWRDSARIAAVCDSRIFTAEHILAADSFSVYGGAAGGSGEHAVRRGGRWHDRRPAQLQMWNWWRRELRILFRRCLAEFRRRARLRARLPTSVPARGRRWRAWCMRSRCWGFCWWLRRWPATFRWPRWPAVLFVVAYNMGEWKEIGGILQLDFTAISVWLVTFALTVFADLDGGRGRGNERWRRCSTFARLPTPPRSPR
jgi:hypothetical protein